MRWNAPLNPDGPGEGGCRKARERLGAQNLSTMKFLRILNMAALWLMLQPGAQAVAFKAKNDASFSVRIRVADRGSWRPWVTFNPGDWGPFAESVERAHHSVQLEVWTSSGWNPAYSGTHGSFMFTRVLQVIDGPNGYPLLAWWDEPPGCRGMPPHPSTGGGTCLKESGGWYWRKVYSFARRVGQAYAAGQ